MLFPLIYSTLRTVAADDDIEETFEDIDWNWEYVLYIAIAVTIAILFLTLMKNLWKSCKKDKTSKKDPLLPADNAHPTQAPPGFQGYNQYPPSVYPPGPYASGQYPPVQYPPGVFPPQENYGYINPNAYPYLPPPPSAPSK